MHKEALCIGLNTDTKNIVYLTEKQRSTHMQVIGSTGTGKSKFLEHLIREDIKADHGLCLIDPHGYLYRDILKWLQAIDWPMDKVILFDPSNDDFVTGFNPLKLTGKDLSYHVDTMVRACAKVWGGEDTDKTPLLKRCLRITFHALAEHQLTLLEAQYLTSPTNKLAREFLAKAIKDPIIKEQWEYFNSAKMTPKLFYDEFGSTINRLMEFLAAERLRNIIGQTQQALDVPTIMDKGYVLLVNLSSGKSVSYDNAQLLGALIVNDLFVHATDRNPGARAFYLYIDECGLFINEDIARILDEGRKFGLHLVLAHQHLAQLKKAGEDVYYSVMTDAKTKVVFGGLSPEDAKILAEQMYLGEIDLDEYKHSLDRPTVVGYTTTWLKNYSKGTAEGTSHTESITYTEGTTTTRGSNRSEAVAKGDTRGTSYGVSSTYGNNALPFEISHAISQGEMNARSASKSSMRGYSESLAFQVSEARGESHGRTYQESFQEGKSQALKTILEDRPTATYSLQDQIWKAMDTLVNQPTQHAIVKLPGLLTKRVMVPTVEELATSSDETVPFYIQECNEDSEFNKEISKAKEEIEQRHNALKIAIEQYREAKEQEGEQKSVRQKKPASKQPAKATTPKAESPASKEKPDGQGTAAPQQKKQRPI